VNRRLFVALDPPDPVRRRLGTIQAELKRALGDKSGEVRWVALPQAHLTLQFLGAVPEERVLSVTAALRTAASSIDPFELEVRGAGGFPNARRARVLWAGVEGSLGEMTRLVAALGHHLSPLGFSPEDRPMSPHLTLGRSRDPRGVSGLAAALDEAASRPGAPWRASEVILFESHLSREGPRYEPLVRAGLGRAGTE
jgi:RNA 2',3'-cyclic 3'-phosphodiesterase